MNFGDLEPGTDCADHDHVFTRFLRRLGFVRLRDFNLRVGMDGMLVPINRNQQIPIDLGPLRVRPSFGPLTPNPALQGPQQAQPPRQPPQQAQPLWQPPQQAQPLWQPPQQPHPPLLTPQRVQPVLQRAQPMGLPSAPRTSAATPVLPVSQSNPASEPRDFALGTADGLTPVAKPPPSPLASDLKRTAPLRPITDAQEAVVQWEPPAESTAEDQPLSAPEIDWS